MKSQHKWKVNKQLPPQKSTKTPTLFDLRQLDRLPESDTAVIAKQLLGGGAGAIGWLEGEKAKRWKESLGKWSRSKILSSLMCRSLPTAGYFKVFVSNCWISSPISLIHLPIFVSKPNDECESWTGGIDYMHSKSVMHRDIKAENVLLTEWSATAVVTRLHICRTCQPWRNASFQWILGDIFPWVTKVLFVREGFKRMMSNFMSQARMLSRYGSKIPQLSCQNTSSIAFGKSWCYENGILR